MPPQVKCLGAAIGDDDAGVLRRSPLISPDPDLVQIGAVTRNFHFGLRTLIQYKPNRRPLFLRAAFFFRPRCGSFILSASRDKIGREKKARVAKSREPIFGS